MNDQLSAKEIVKQIRERSTDDVMMAAAVRTILEKEEEKIQNAKQDLRNEFCKALGVNMSSYTEKLKDMWQKYLDHELENRLKDLAKPKWYTDRRYTDKKNSTLYEGKPIMIPKEYVVGPDKAPEIEFELAKEKSQEKAQQSPNEHEEINIIRFIAELPEYKSWEDRIEDLYVKYDDRRKFKGQLLTQSKDILRGDKISKEYELSFDENDEYTPEIKAVSKTLGINKDNLKKIMQFPYIADRFKLLNGKINIKKNVKLYDAAAFIYAMIDLGLIPNGAFKKGELFLEDGKIPKNSERELSKMKDSDSFSPTFEHYKKYIYQQLRRS